MSQLDVKIRQITEVLPHDNSDRLEILKIGGYQAVVLRGIHHVGDLILYIPLDSIFSDISIAQKLNVATYLKGSNHDRVGGIRLRGKWSEGIVLPLSTLQEFFPGSVLLQEGSDWAAVLGIIKYEPPVPIHLAGKVRPWPHGIPKYDIENLRKPESMALMQDGEEVVCTSKMHGTNFSCCITKSDPNTVIVCSRNLALEEDDQNAYWKAVKKYKLDEKIKLLSMSSSIEYAIAIRGEVLGVQKNAKYGFVNGDVGFMAFDIFMDGKYLNYDDFCTICDNLDIPRVIEMYRGSYSFQKMEELCTGKTPGFKDVLEGIVVKPVIEREDILGNRIQLKLISPDYLSQKDVEFSDFH